jgi:superfamily I DNA/RNA helicase
MVNSFKTPEFIPGPPGTGKTHIWLKEKYAELLKKYSWERIVVLSHTVLAAKEIREFGIRVIGKNIQYTNIVLIHMVKV